MRTVEYWDYDAATWSGIEWSAIVSGTVVRMYEENGDPMSTGVGIYEMNVISDAYQVTVSGIGDVWHIDIEDPEPTPVPRSEE